MVSRCEVCGNPISGGVRLIADGMTHVFDSFQCAIHRLAPECEYCGCKVLGRPTVVGRSAYCDEWCAQAASSPPVPVYPLHLRVRTISGSSRSVRPE
jgi:hypothetical protein